MKKDHNGMINVRYGFSLVEAPDYERDENGKKKNIYWNTRIIDNWNVIRSLLIKGVNQYDVAKQVGVGRGTWDVSKAKYPEFREHVATSRNSLVSDIETSLFQKALGTSVENSTMTRRKYNQYTGEWIDVEQQVSENTNKANNTAMIAALKYLSREWRDALTDSGNTEVTINLDQLNAIAEGLESVGSKGIDKSQFEETTDEDSDE